MPAVEHEDAIAAYVGGDVTVLLDGAKVRQIFGANNLNGTPKGDVLVHVKRTVNSTQNSSKNQETPRDERTTYDVEAVYGGGNQADYIPTKATGTGAEEGQAAAKVIIEGCDTTSIQYVYGGGNAAAVPATDVTILGSYIIEYVFGGGNGKGEGNPGANIGTYDNGSTEYGTGKAVTKLVGGHIIYVFGGSDTKGNVRGGTSLTMPESDGYAGYDYCDIRDIKEIYGAGNKAEQDGEVTLILGCVDNMDYVYGGAREANVKGGVDLVVTSGSFKGVFGGNNLSGTIQGPITVTIEETGCKPLEIDSLYLGGNQAAYSVYGYKEVTNEGVTSLVARSSLTDGIAVNPPAPAYSDSQLYRDPILNIVSCTSIGNAFGGGLGNGAVMYGNPTVNVNMIPGDYAKDIDRNNDGSADNDKTALGTITNVYGGGQEANVEGNTTVNICTADSVTVRSKMGAAVTNKPTAVQGALITDNVFGAGKGVDTNVNSAMVSGNTTVTMTKGSVGKSVYGGGELSQVGGNTTITVSGGTIGITGEGGATYGNIYGGGFGDDADVRFGLVKGNTNITVSDSAHVDHNVYGGGAYGSVGDFVYDENTGMPTDRKENTSGGTANITITGGVIGIDGHENGMVFGASRGDVGAPGSIDDKLAWVYDTRVIIGTENDATDGPQIIGSLYGSGENGHTLNNTSVTLNSGTIGTTATMATDPEGQGGAKYPYRGNVYGGGCGTDKYDSDSNGSLDAYNPLSGIVKGTATVTINGGHVVRNLYGAGAMGSVDGLTTIVINGGTIGAENSGGGYVYAASRGDDTLSDEAQAYAGSTALTINGGTVWGDAFGGGQAGIAKGSVTVNLNGGTLKRDVYGGGALANTNTVAVEGVYPATNVTLAGATIVGNLYGGGLGRLAVAGTSGTPAVYTAIADGTTLTSGNTYYTSDEGAGEFTSDGTEVANGTNYFELTTAAVAGVAPVQAVAADVKGPVKVMATSGSATNVFGCNNVNGMPKSTVEVEIGAKSGSTLSGTATISGSVYGGGNQAACTGSPTVRLYGGTVTTNVYGGGLGSTAVTGGSTVAMEGGTVGNDLYGGGSQADVTGSVSVSISGGTVTNDVYGGGALANTNKANWNGDGRLEYVEVTGLTGETYRVKEVVEGADVTGLYTKDGSNYVKATGTAVSGTTYYEKLDGTPVAGYYKDALGSAMYRSTTDVATTDGHYYKKKVSGTWVSTPPNNGDYYTTTVSLTGGLIGNAYGGGLGRQAADAKPAVGTEGQAGYVPAQPAVEAVAANVYGDVRITVNEGVTDATKGVTFIQRLENPVIGGTEIITPTSGRVFGCNNHNGTPTGNVEVHVYATRQIDKSNKIIPGHGSSDRKYTYEIQSVYGGGNQADYLPADGKKSQVIIEGCQETSIEKVYGGGNSAVVPETDVLIKGGYDIGYGFGGGNGDKPIKKADGKWYENEGAIVIGMAKIVCQGGKIGQVFGGGDSKGSCGNTTAVTAQVGDCPLSITRLYGAGNKGDVAAVNIVLGACSGEPIEYVHGGSYNAHVTGDVHLTITSGVLKNVYGGNDARGGIGGNITVDIEETNGCNPIIIQNLVGGGNEAPYPGTHTVTNSATNQDEEVPYTTRGKITVNVKSATRIDNIYGGSFMAEADADTEVNINMIKGIKAGTTVRIPKEFSYIPNISRITEVAGTNYIDCRINDSIGTIGNVYGGGNQGVVKGNTVVNIGSSDKVSIMQRDANRHILAKEGETTVTIDAENGSNITGKTILYDPNNPALGAHITGHVYGGGNLADVRSDTMVVEGVKQRYGGNTQVNICAKWNDTEKRWESVAEGAGKVTIAGNVYGGGKGSHDTFECEKAMVGANNNSAGIANPDGEGTYVRIGNGTVGTLVNNVLKEGTGNVYGGGELGRVEWSTAVMIGLNDGAASAPVIRGNVFGAGQGVYTHGYSGLVRGNSAVTIQAGAKVGRSVYGGGEKATVGRYVVTSAGIPTTPVSGGNCTVTIQGNAEIGPDDMQMPTFSGNVFGAGKGVVAYEGVTGTPYSIKPTGPVYYNDTTAYLGHLETLALASYTYVTIAGNAFVIRPPYPLGISRTEDDPAELRRVYDIGRAEMERLLPDLKEFLAAGH